MLEQWFVGADAKFAGVVDVNAAPFVEKIVEKVPSAEELIGMFHVWPPFGHALVDVENDNISAAR